jgi:hypothetical protein
MSAEIAKPTLHEHLGVRRRIAGIGDARLRRENGESQHDRRR